MKNAGAVVGLFCQCQHRYSPETSYVHSVNLKGMLHTFLHEVVTVKVTLSQIPIVF